MKRVPHSDGGAGLVAPAPRLRLRELVRRFWPYARPYRVWIVAVLVLIGLSQAVDTAIIWLFKPVVDEVLVPHDLGALLPFAIAYLALVIAGGFVSFADDWLSTWVGERFLLGLRTSVFRHLQGLSLDFFERRRLGDLIARLTGDVGAIETLVLSGVTDAISYVLRIAFFAGALFLLDWQLALFALVVTPVFWLIARHFARRIKEASREKRRRSGSLSAVAEESLANAQLVQAYGREDWEVDRFHREGVGAFRAEMASTRLKALFTPLIDLVEVAGAVIVLAAGAWALSRDRISIGGLLAFLAYLSQLYSPVRSLSRLAGRLLSATAGAERIAELLEERPTVGERSDAAALGRASGGVRFDGVRFRYPGVARPAIDGLSFALEPGSTLALVGPSGAGKSTAAKLLLRFYDPEAGRVLVDGRDVRELSLRSLRENVAVLLQETLVLDGSIRDNIAYGRPGASEAEIVRAARDADAHEFIMALPDGYDTQVGQRGRRLSGGQRQRLAIARAMVRDAPILVLDEPTTGLDAESSRRVLDPLRRLMAGRTTIVISHNLMTARYADLVLVLDHGREVERGSHEELVARGGAYARVAALALAS
jgi:ATP-binding cassette, subfamily B, bacterial